MIEALMEWVCRHSQGLEDSGVKVAFEHGPADRPKRGASLFLDSHVLVAQLLLWETGESELEVVDLATGTFLLNEHRELQSAADLEQALWTLVDAIAPSYRASHV